MKPLLFALLLAFSNTAFAELDGTWLKKSLDAFARTTAKTGTPEDASEATTMLAYLSGVLAVHRNNNLGALVLYSVRANTAKGRKPSAEDIAVVRTASMFAPLIRLPDDASPEQLVAIVTNYVNAHPEKWKSGANILITDGLAQAFP